MLLHPVKPEPYSPLEDLIVLTVTKILIGLIAWGFAYV